MVQMHPNKQGRRRDYLTSYVERFGGCWLFTGSINNRGYGTILGRTAHRYFYTHLVGPIPEGMQLDHLCRTRGCVNPAHLEPVTPAENIRRAFRDYRYCQKGHEMTPENTYTYVGRTKYTTCRICRTATKRRENDRLKLARAERRRS